MGYLCSSTLLYKGMNQPVGGATSRGRPGVLLDRDGTIIVDHGYVGSPDRVELVDGAAAAIARLNQAGIPVAVVTNQSGVARGYYGLDDVAKVHERLSKELADEGAHVDLFVFCPYHPDGVVEAFARWSDDRKPGGGMARAAAVALGLDLSRSWVVGDRPEDMGLAAAVGARAIYIGAGAVEGIGVEGIGVVSLPGLPEAAQYILESSA